MAKKNKHNPHTLDAKHILATHQKTTGSKEIPPILKDPGFKKYLEKRKRKSANKFLERLGLILGIIFLLYLVFGGK